jgi:hypothetical protein
VDPSVSLGDLEKRKFVTLQGLELGPLGRPTRSQSLYRLRDPGSCYLLLPLRFIFSEKKVSSSCSQKPATRLLS